MSRDLPIPASPASRTTCAAPPPFGDAAPGRVDPRELGFAADERRPVGAEQSNRECGRRRGDALAERVGELLRLVRRPRSEPGDEAAAELGVLGERGAAVAGCVQPAHQRAVDLLRERLERGLTPRQRDRAAQIAVPCGGRRQLLEQRDETFAVLVLCLERPLLVETGEEGAVAERERLVAAPVGAQALGLEHVDPRVRRQADAIACRDERLLAERAAERPERAAQARAGALVQHVGPEDGGDGRSRLEAGAEGEPGEQRARPPGRKRTAFAVDLRGDLAHEPQPQHRQSVTRPC